MTDPRDATVPAYKCFNCPHYARIDEVTFCQFCSCTEHRGSPAQGHDPATPPGAEARLEAYRDELDTARQDLARARDAEMEAEQARNKGRREAVLSPDCPQTGVFDGVRITVAYRDAWVEDQIADLEMAYQLARTARRAAADRLHILGKQGGFQQSITASVRESYRGSGRQPWS